MFLADIFQQDKSACGVLEWKYYQRQPAAVALVILCFSADGRILDMNDSSASCIQFLAGVGCVFLSVSHYFIGRLQTRLHDAFTLIFGDVNHLFLAVSNCCSLTTDFCLFYVFILYLYRNKIINQWSGVKMLHYFIIKYIILFY